MRQPVAYRRTPHRKTRRPEAVDLVGLGANSLRQLQAQLRRQHRID